MSLDDTTRQQRLLSALAHHVERSAEVGALVVVGSFADGTADAVSDLDLFFVTYAGRFDDAWQRRHDLHVTGTIVGWDQLDTSGASVAGHRWVTPDLVLVESVISEPAGGGRLAEPFRVVAGDAELVKGFPKRPAVEPAATTGGANHPVSDAYDRFKKAVRDASGSSL